MARRAQRFVQWRVFGITKASGGAADCAARRPDPADQRPAGDAGGPRVAREVDSPTAHAAPDAGTGHYLTGTDRYGTRIERSARVRTLLPLLRNAVMVLLITVVSLVTLSEFGVNIAPLLAGAGVIGLAIGFGSQTLVKDVITGLFILFEDTISVGDVVDVGNGHSGLVGAITIRTIKLRDMAGGVHSIPFSQVNSVLNMTKDFSYYVLDIAVAHGEDPDRVGSSRTSGRSFRPRRSSAG
jgi:hypothetical protein